ncbi:type IV pilus twitching motility protein PilT [Cryobacterium zhongshanensis]|uniref:PilT/PilU family type 4a pilus ATPase n=1 Tax=Cryobacterium zhongshanensis TaxID=2928153 RepID=A0AA41QRS8_9MICO|nr:type IV pilus twitching motility protein PilT [Cryobacterium zhongshanensis]MCI4656456.1 PilT/PilU family type 4a pilus ATPase [Cryobacterium zhongshanensis]
MDKPIYEIPAVEPGENVSWWDQIAAGPAESAALEKADAERTAAERVAAERTARLQAAVDNAAAERRGAQLDETGGHGFERRSARRTESDVVPAPLLGFAAPAASADEDLDDADVSQAEPPRSAIDYTLPLPVAAPYTLPGTLPIGPPAGKPFIVPFVVPTSTPEQDDRLVSAPAPTRAYSPPPASAPQPARAAGRRAAIQAEPERHLESERPHAPVHIGPDGRPADQDLIDALHLVLELEASDLHITVGAPPTIRIDGALRPIEGLPVWLPDKVNAALHSIISPADLERFEDDRELDFAYTAAGARFRVNFYHQRNSIGAAFRLIPREIKPLKELGVPESVGRFSLLPRGLVLVTGPTGSGKSTTLAAMVDLANSTRPDHIVTVEDPIEFLHKHKKSLVNQREVGHDTKSFAAALKHVLRQDPDIILIGELRDLETISVALTAAETGHLVFATLHTQDAAQTIDRMIDVFPPHQQGQIRTQLAATLRGVVCQTLVKRANQRGRVVATEILVTTPAIANLIREGKTHQITSMMQAGGSEGMHTMDQHLADLVDSGQITRQAALDKAHDVESLQQLIKRADTTTDDSSRTMGGGGVDYGDTYSIPQR